MPRWEFCVVVYRCMYVSSFVYIYVCVCLSVRDGGCLFCSLCVCVCVCVCVSVCVYMYMCVCISGMYVHARRRINQSINQSMHTCIHTHAPCTQQTNKTPIHTQFADS